jgi:nicotinamide-nucleotide amidase
VRYARFVASPLLTAELISIGSELTVGETRDTNSGELARSLTERGVRVLRIQALPDDLDVVEAAFAEGLTRADVVISTGGLGPTPDDLTREAIAAMCAEEPVVDPTLEAWLRTLWARRGIAFPELNLKQAWLIPSAVAIPNPNGTAPGWWVERAEGRIVVALPGPPREMRPMWAEWVLPRLLERGLGRQIELRTLRLHGIGESQAADRLGDTLLRAPNPVVATYARADAVDVRISAVDEDGRTAHQIADETEAVIVAQLGEHVWARGATTWAEAIAEALDAHGWSLATTEAGTGGSLAGLIGEIRPLRLAEVRAEPASDSPEADAHRIRTAGHAAVGLAVASGSHRADTEVSVAVASPAGVHRERRVAFLGGSPGRSRAALAAADILLRQLRQPEAKR